MLVGLIGFFDDDGLEVIVEIVLEIIFVLVIGDGEFVVTTVDASDFKIIATLIFDDLYFAFSFTRPGRNVGFTDEDDFVFFDESIIVGFKRLYWNERKVD